MASLVTQVRIALLGGNPSQAESFVAAAAAQGALVDYFESMQAVGFLGRFREYQGAIVHADLEPLSGLELAEYFEKFFLTLPLILLSETRAAAEALPRSIIEQFCPSEAQASRVLERLIEAMAPMPRMREGG